MPLPSAPPTPSQIQSLSLNSMNFKLKGVQRTLSASLCFLNARNLQDPIRLKRCMGIFLGWKSLLEKKIPAFDDRLSFDQIRDFKSLVAFRRWCVLRFVLWCVFSRVARTSKFRRKRITEQNMSYIPGTIVQQSWLKNQG